MSSDFIDIAAKRGAGALSPFPLGPPMGTIEHRKRIKLFRFRRF
jgi:hypothetical protein